MQYKIIVDKQSRTSPSPEKKEYTIDIEELRYKGDVCDTLNIEKDRAYVTRKLSLSELHVLTVLKEPVIEPLKNLNIELFEGDNYIYLIDMIGNKFYAEYLIKNEFNELYVINAQMNSAINQAVSSIELSVNQKLASYSTTQEMNAAIQILSNAITLELVKKINDEDLTGASIVLRINNNTSQAKIKADKIELLANDILNLLSGAVMNLTSKNIVITSNNFSVDTDGKVTATSGTIGGFTLNSNNFFASTKSEYAFNDTDLTIVRDYIMGTRTLTDEEKMKYDINGDGRITSSDYVLIKKIVESGKSFAIKGSIEINAKNTLRNFILRDESGTIRTSVGLSGMQTESIGAEEATIEQLKVNNISCKKITELENRIEALEGKAK